MMTVRLLLCAGAAFCTGCSMTRSQAAPAWSGGAPAVSGHLPHSAATPRPAPRTGSGSSLTGLRPPAAVPTGVTPGRVLPEPYRPDLAVDPQLRTPFEALASPGDADRSLTNEHSGPGHNGSSGMPIIPDPNALGPATGELAQNPNSTWTVREPNGGAIVRHERISAGATSSGGRWRTVGYSQGGRPLELKQFGDGGKTVLMIGSLAGNERESVSLVEALADLFEREPDRIQGLTVVLLRTPNPDGLVEGTLTNSRGVALNRNFPSSNFLRQRTAETGLAPASEPEVQALLGLLDDLRPERLVHIRCGNYQRTLVLANRAAADSLLRFRDASWLDLGEYEAYKAGSIEEFTEERLRAELVVVSLSRESGSWRNRLDPLANMLLDRQDRSTDARASVADTTPRPRAPETSGSGVSPGGADLFAPYEPPVRLSRPEGIASTPTAGSALPRGKKGYVEILPPPPEFADSSAGLDPKYYELPPPGE